MLTRKEALDSQGIGEDSDKQVQWFDKSNYEKRINAIYDYVEKLERENEIYKLKEMK